MKKLDQQLAPCVIFAYNRVDKLEELLESLLQNPESSNTIVYIFSDGPKNKDDIEKIQKVRSIARTVSGFKKVIVTERQENFGCANNVVSGINHVFQAHPSVIVLEDDAVVSELFLKYMNQTLQHYERNDKIWSITGYAYPLKLPLEYNFDTYLHSRWCSKSFAIWRKNWSKHIFDRNILIQKIANSPSHTLLSLCGPDTKRLFQRYRNNEIDSYAMWFTLNQLLNSKMTVYPKHSYVIDEGLQNGTHTTNALSHNEVFSNDTAKSYAQTEETAVSIVFIKYLRNYILRSYIHRFKQLLGFKNG